MKAQNRGISPYSFLRYSAASLFAPAFAGCLVCFATAAVAADAAADAGTTDAGTAGTASSGEAASDQVSIDEIVVTAQRRSENLERTPVAISVLSGDALEKQDITTETDLRTTAPGLSVRSSSNSNQLTYVIRGQSLDAFSNNRPGVLPYVDEVQVGGAGTASAFYDLASIQVLKGPQGTLFGRNATGGAVLFTTQKPTDDFSGYVDVEGGNYNARKYEGALNAPLLDDKVLVRVAGFFQKRDGFQYNLYTDSRVGDIDRYGFRGSITVKVTDAIQNDFVADYSRYVGSGTAAVLWNLNPNIGAIPATGLYAGGAVSDAYFTGLALASGAPPGTSLAGAWAAYVASHPNTNPNGLASVLADQRANGPFTVDLDQTPSNEARNLIFSNITTFDIAQDTQIKNVLGHTQLDAYTVYDADGTPYDLDINLNRNNTRQTSDELQLLGKTFGERLAYVGGIYYADESAVTHLGSELLALPPFVPATAQHNDFEGINRTIAEYAQGTFDLSDATGVQGLGVTGGARHTSEKIGSDLLPTDSGYAAALVNPAEEIDQQKEFNNVSWTVGVQDQLNSDVLLYVVSRRSYKNGGYNGTLAPVVGPGNIGGNGYLTEQVTDAEFGVKYQGSLAAMPTRLNAAVYNMWILNNQRVAYTLDSFGAPAPISVNVPRAAVDGLELDGQITPVSWLSVGASYNYTDAKFTSNLVSILGRAPIVFGTYPDTPRSMATFYSDVTIPVASGLAVVVHGDLYDQTRIAYSSTANINVGAFLPGYAVADFRVGLESKQGWTVSAIVKNAFNRVYYAGGIAAAELFQFNTAIPGDPRTAALEVHYKF